MKIELELHEGKIEPLEQYQVTDYRKISELEYSISFGNYEFVFIPKTRKDIFTYKESFEDKPWEAFPEELEMNLVLKKDGKIFKEGEWKYSESYKTAQNIKYRNTVSHTIHCGVYDEYTIFMIPDENETWSEIMDRIFHLKK